MPASSRRGMLWLLLRRLTWHLHASSSSGQVAAWEGSKLAAVLFPTGETLGEVRKIADARK